MLHSRSGLTPIALSATLFVAVMLLFWPGLTGGFIFDDFPTLVSNTSLHIKDLSLDAVITASVSFDPGGLGRPLAMATFAINHALGGLDPWGYKLGGLLIHSVNAILVFLLLKQILLLANFPQKHLLPTAFVVSLLWAVHPLQVSTAFYVVQRMETLSLTFVLLALLAYVQGRQRQIQGRAGWWLVVVCLPLLGVALASKETAVLFPVYTLAIELTLLRFAATNKVTARYWRWLYSAGVVLALALYVFFVIPHFGSLDTHQARDFSTIERLLTQCRALPLYLGQIVFPLPNNMLFYYDNYAVSAGLLSPTTTLLGLLLLCSLAVAAWIARCGLPLFSLGVLWFFAGHILTSNVIPLELVFEHRNYFALLGVLLAAAALIARLPVRDGPGIKYFGVAVIVIGVCVLGSVRAALWGEQLTLASYHAEKNPTSARAAHELGVVYYEMSDGYVNSPFFEFAWQQFKRESDMPYSSISAEQNLILMAHAAGKPVEALWWDRIFEKLQNNPIIPDTSSALFALLEHRHKGVPLDEQKILDAFRLMFSRANQRPHVYAQVADFSLRFLNDREAAAELFAQAIKRSARDPDYAVRVIIGLEKNGEYELAMKMEELALEPVKSREYVTQQLLMQRELLK